MTQTTTKTDRLGMDSLRNDFVQAPTKIMNPGAQAVPSPSYSDGIESFSRAERPLHMLVTKAS